MTKLTWGKFIYLPNVQNTLKLWISIHILSGNVRIENIDISHDDTHTNSRGHIFAFKYGPCD